MSAHSPWVEVGDAPWRRSCASAALTISDAVVVGRAVVGRVVDVDVPDAVARDLRVVVRERRLLGRAEGGRDVRPAGRVGRGRPAGTDAERVRARRLAGQVVVEQRCRESDEGAEVDDRALQRRHEVARADPLHRDDRLAGALGRLADVCRPAGCPVVAKLVRVVEVRPRRSGGRCCSSSRARPARCRWRACTSRRRCWAGSPARRPFSPVTPCFIRSPAWSAWRPACAYLLHQIRPHAVRGEEDDGRCRSARPRAASVGGSATGRPDRHRASHEQRERERERPPRSVGRDRSVRFIGLLSPG